MVALGLSVRRTDIKRKIIFTSLLIAATASVVFEKISERL
jgi:hypothetical protein